MRCSGSWLRCWPCSSRTFARRKSGRRRSGILRPDGQAERVFVLTLIALYCGLAPHGWQPALAWPPQLGLMGIGLAIIIAGELWTAARRLLRIVRALEETAP